MKSYLNKLQWVPPCLILGLLFLFACGKKGPLVAPVKKIPKSAQAAAVHQQGSTAVLIWRNPAAYIDGSPLDALDKIEIYAARTPIEEFPSGISAGVFREKAVLSETIPQDNLAEYAYPENPALQSYRYSFDLDDINKTVLAFALKIYDERGKASEFSDPVSLAPATVPQPPQELKVKAEPDGVGLSWEPPEKNINGTTPALAQGYNIYKKIEGDPVIRINRNPVTETQYQDTAIEWGVTYTYWVRASASAASVYPESEDSDSAVITPEDTFPPEPPEGLTALAGGGFVALSWRAPRVSDLQGYRVWRRKEGEDKYTVLTQEPIREASYTDNAAESSVKYHYQVTALDTAGNESGRSEAVAVTVRK